MAYDTQLMLTAGTPILYGGNRLAYVGEDLAARFRPGDRLVVVQETGDLLLIPERVHEIASESISRALTAFGKMGAVTDDQVTSFYDTFATMLADDVIWAKIGEANAVDVEGAKARGRSTTRLVATDKMRRAMIEGLHEWRDAVPVRGRVLESVSHDGWDVEQVMAPLGVVAFVFEGRPNVFADATGVLRGGNTVVFRIGSDALGTAKAIVEHALTPALTKAGLPEGAVVLLESSEHAAGWALFSDSRLSLAVARGSGRAVSQLGSVARQSGVPVSLHGTGGAWIVVDGTADADKLAAAIYHSLDRKVCNTLNVICLPRGRADLIGVFQEAMRLAGAKDERGFKVHVVSGDEAAIPAAWLTERVGVRRADGVSFEPIAEGMNVDDLGREWEWEDTPEVSVKLIDSTAEGVALFNQYSPQFVASLIAESADAHQAFYEGVNAPFVGNGFTRWVDGLYALGRPELGLSNWQFGRLFARSAILSGDGIFSVRTRVTQSNWDVRR